MPTYRNTNDYWVSDKGMLFKPDTDTPCTSFHDVDGLVMVGNDPPVNNYDVLHNGSLPVTDLEDIAKYSRVIIKNYTGDEVRYRAIIGHDDGEWIPIQDYEIDQINLRQRWDGIQIDGDGNGKLVIIAEY